MSGTAIYSNLPSVLAQQKLTVSRLERKLRSLGERVNIKTLYRWTSTKPLERIDGRITAAICSTCHVSLSDLLTLEPPKQKLLKLDKTHQDRLDRLMDKNTEGQLTAGETKELKDLVSEAEEITLENARILAAQQKAFKRHGAG
jgi:hypothetical protein